MLRVTLILLLLPSIALADCTISLISEYPLPELSGTLAVDGDYLYVGCRSDGLYVLNISDPSAPSLVSTTAGYTGAMTIRDDAAYIASSPGLRCVDVSDPANPAVLGEASFPFGALARDIALGGDYIFAGTNLGYLMVVSIQDPTNPAVVGWWLADEQINAVAVQGDRAFTAQHYYGLGVVDISVPSNPQLLGRESTYLDSYDVAVRDDLVCIVDLRFDGFRTIDVSDPTHPTTIGGLPDEAGGYDSLLVRQNAAYLQNGWNLRAIDLTDPTSPAIVGSYQVFFGANTLAVQDDMAFLLGNVPKRLLVLDISDCNRAINCPADIDRDGKVDPFDSNACMARFGCAVDGGDPICDRCDLDGDGVVNPFDSNAVMAAFGDCP